MKPPLSIDQLKRLKVIMQMMLSEANNANWQELSRLDSERRVLIDFDAAVFGKNKDAVDPASGGRIRPLDIQREPVSQARASSSTQGARSSSALGEISTGSKPDPEYLALCTELVAIDEEISSTVQKARQVLLEQTRGFKAQVSAKKEYEQANTMKVSSYS